MIPALALALWVGMGEGMGVAQAGTPPDVVARLEQLYTEGRHAEVVALGRGLLLQHPQDPELHWRVARAYFEVGELVERDDPLLDKESWYREMLALSDAGLALAPGHPHLLFARGAALARIGTTRGIAASLMLADDIEAAWLAAARDTAPYASLGREEVLPCDIYLCLGVFYRLLPDSWLVEAITGTRGSLRAARDWTARAYACSPDRINVVKEYGVAHLCYGQHHRDEAAWQTGMHALHAARQIPARTAVDALDHRHIDALLAEPDRACAYSRDGQVVTDPEAIRAQHPPPPP